MIWWRGYMTNATKYELEGLKYIIRTISVNTINSWESWGQWNIKAVYKYDQLMKSWGQWNVKRKYKYNQLMKVMRTWNIKVVYITFLI